MDMTHREDEKRSRDERDNIVAAWFAVGLALAGIALVVFGISAFALLRDVPAWTPAAQHAGGQR